MATKMQKAVPIRLPMAHLIFVYGLNALETAYKASTEPLHVTIREANSAEKKIDYAADPPDFDAEAYSNIYNAKSTASLLREAFLITLFHFWERQANLWLGTPGEYIFMIVP